MIKEPPTTSDGDKQSNDTPSNKSLATTPTDKGELYVKSDFTLKDILQKKFAELGVDLKDISKIKQLISIWDKRERLDVIDELQLGTITKFTQGCDITVPTMSKFLDHLFTLDFPLNLEIFEGRKNTNSMVYSTFDQLETAEYSSYVKKYGRKISSHVKQELTTNKKERKKEIYVKVNNAESAVDYDAKKELRTIIMSKKEEVELISDHRKRDFAKSKLNTAINNCYLTLKETKDSVQAKAVFLKEIGN